MSKAVNRLMRRTPVPPPLIRTPETKDSLVERPGVLPPPSPAKEGHVEAQREAERAAEEAERAAAEALLRAKYRQYRSMLAPGSSIIRIDPVRVVAWGDLEPDPPGAR